MSSVRIWTSQDSRVSREVETVMDIIVTVTTLAVYRVDARSCLPLLKEMHANATTWVHGRARARLLTVMIQMMRNAENLTRAKMHAFRERVTVSDGY